MSDASQKTEQPTQQRLQKARKEGRFPVSRELLVGGQFLLFVTLLDIYGPTTWTGLRQGFATGLSAAFHQALDADSVQHALSRFIINTLWLLALLGGLFVGVPLLLQLVSTRMGFSASKLKPDLKRLNPASRLMSLPKQNAQALIQALLGLVAGTILLYVALRGQVDALFLLPLLGAEAAVGRGWSLVRSLLWKAAIALALYGVIDLWRQQKRHNKELRMTKQEVRQEAKESEGSPETKGRIRRLQRSLRRRKMMQDVATASAVVVNPTHYAVAIRYRPESMAAPLVIAKGKNYLALRIKQRAMDHEIPIVENAPLAQGLYKSVEVGQEIPAHLYRAVAEILAYIFRLMNGRLPG